MQNKYGQGANGVLSAISANSLGPVFGSAPSLANGLIVAPNTTQYVNGVLYTAGQTVPYQAYPDNIMNYFETGTIVDENLTINSVTVKTIMTHYRQFKTRRYSSYINSKQILVSHFRLCQRQTVYKRWRHLFSTVQEGITQGIMVLTVRANVIRIPRGVDFDYYKDHYTTRADITTGTYQYL